MNRIIRVEAIVRDVEEFPDPCIFVSPELKIVVHLFQNMAL